jgi:hypothetical protein
MFSFCDFHRNGRELHWDEMHFSLLRWDLVVCVSHADALCGGRFFYLLWFVLASWPVNGYILLLSAYTL